MTLFEYLMATYGTNEPILVSEVQKEGMTKMGIRQEMKRLTDRGKLKRFDTGIYYIPVKIRFASGSCISRESVLKKKYLMDGEECCGYMGACILANQMGLTTQVPMVYEVISNKVTCNSKETYLTGVRLILRKPRTLVNEKNSLILQFLDLILQIDFLSEIEGENLTERLLNYMRNVGLQVSSLKPYLKYYPDKIYRNLYEVGLLCGREV